jgi:hypothetical protein
LEVRFGRSVELLGLTGPEPGPAGGQGLTLYWRATAPVGEIYHVRLRLVDHDGREWWRDADVGHHAANNYYPTLAWRPGEVVADYHEIPPFVADSTVSARDCIVQVGLFRPFSDIGLKAENGETWYALTQLDLQGLADPPGPTHELRVRFADPTGTPAQPAAPLPQRGASETACQAIEAVLDGPPWGLCDDRPTLVGVDLPDVVAADTRVDLTLHWRFNHAVVTGRPALTWIKRQGSTIEAQDVEIWGRSRILLKTPALPGVYHLRLGWMDQEGQPLPARCGWLARRTDTCTLATVHVTASSASALANFDGKMLLLDVGVGVSTLLPGQDMSLTLYWQGLQPMKEDYTVSVQLIGPDGRLWGQTDAWPVQGTLPTSQWLPSQRIADPYTVALPADAPSGRYQVGVVVYLLATQTRLPLVGESGQATGDIVWVGELEVVGEEK